MRFEVIAYSGCGGGNCPTTYATENDTVLVQGNVVTDPEVLAKLGIPDGEAVVEVPAHLLVDHVNRVKP